MGRLTAAEASVIDLLNSAPAAGLRSVKYRQIGMPWTLSKPGSPVRTLYRSSPQAGHIQSTWAAAIPYSEPGTSGRREVRELTVSEV
jgi:hypothetical protein